MLGFKVNDKDLKRFESGMRSVKSAALAVGATLTAVAGSAIAIVKSVANQGDALGEMSKQIGFTTDSIQKLAYAFGQSGVSQGELNQGLRFFSKTLGQAKTGSKSAIEAFKNLGIDPKKFKTTEETFLAVADAIQKTTDPAKKSAYVTALLGRAGAKYLPAFENGSEGLKKLGERLEALNGIIGPKAVAASDKFNDSWNDVMVVINGLKNTIGLELMPVIQELINEFLDWYILNKPEIIKKLKQGIKDVGFWMRRLAVWIGLVGDKTEEINAKFERFKHVLNIIKWIIGAIIGLQFLSFLGNVSLGLFAIGKMATATLAPLLALSGGAAALAVIIAAVGALTYAFYDLYQFLNDKQGTISGMILNIFSGLRGIDTWSEAKDQMKKDLIWWEIQFIKMKKILSESFSDPLTAFKNLAIINIDIVIAYLKKQFGFLKFLFPKLDLPDLKMVPLVKNAQSNVASVTRAPLTGRTSALGTTIQNNNNGSYTQNVNVNVTTNADPKAIADTVKKATEDNWASIMRKTLRANQSGAF